MPKIDLTLRIKTADGEIKENLPTQEVEAYGEIAFELLGEETKCIEVQPSNKDKLIFLLIKSSRYTDEQDNNNKILYDAKLDREPEIELDKPHFYQGVGEISISQEEPKILKFKSTYPAGTTDEEKEKNKAQIEILVGRQAVVSCPSTP
ncbi:MAG: hypothetical protein QNJ46_08590 [Leptolyngbyaceae cyanobacterium MO_188.B28]|nr:hypothetical protein [Leptolyngbyaceae cyanobacterium MO_188.B28]